MKQIEKFMEQITDELDDTRNYAKWAAEIKEKWPDIAETLYTISTQEYKHATMLHEAVMKIKERRMAEGSLPEGALEFCSYMQNKHVDMMADAKAYQDIYKEM